MIDRRLFERYRIVSNLARLSAESHRDTYRRVNAIKTTFAAPPHTANGTDGKPVTGYFAAGWFVSVTRTRQLSYRYGGHSGAAAMLKYEGDGFGWALITNCIDTQSKQHIANAINKSGLGRAIKEARKNLGL